MVELETMNLAKKWWDKKISRQTMEGYENRRQTKSDLGFFE